MKKVFLMMLVLAIAGISQAALTGSWALDDGTGNTATDSSGYGNDGTVTSGTWGTDYLTFDGTDTRVDIPNADWNGEYWCLDADTQFTVTWELDIRTAVDYVSAADNGDCLMLFSDTDDALPHVKWNKSLAFTSTGHLQAGAYGITSIDGETTTAVNDGEWHHVKMVWDIDTTSGVADTVQIFVDGTKEWEDTASDVNLKDTLDGEIASWTAPGMILGYNEHVNQATRDYKWDPFDGDMKNVSVTYVPEPATMLLLGLGAIPMLRRKKA